ncbi:helix-turn-helix transcriptional regulator [Flavobacterium denitrificans]|uniref:helix-turn-helix transcriptional regulator n=1 Tax=Flavobacterium denitrificans TaxID=281361 RepID=UPI000400C332|nr:hypothetical protein [Flavobacterium denitrificans]
MTTQVQTNRVFPGMICQATEFLVMNDEVKVLNNGKLLPFSDVSHDTLALLEDAINADPEVKNLLLKIHPESQFKRIEEFVKCRFGGLDFEGDIVDGNLQEGEYWECPERGQCANEGILCKLPKYNNKRLKAPEIPLIKLLCTDATNEAIADKLSLPMGSFHKAKKHLYQKLNVQTKQEIVIIAISLNLIQW